MRESLPQYLASLQRLLPEGVKLLVLMPFGVNGVEKVFYIVFHYTKTPLCNRFKGEQQKAQGEEFVKPFIHDDKVRHEE